ncbi:MAG: hypothetical protein U0075_08720 [Thermomicrobiales bacterium]
MTFPQRVCEGISPEWPRDVDTGKAFAAAALAANRIRNTYAHASYGAAGEAGSEVLRVAVFAETTSSAARVEIATPELLDAEIRFLKSLVVVMSNYVEARTANAPVNLQEIQDLVSITPMPVQHTPQMT